MKNGVKEKYFVIKMKVALFISGRCFGYKECLIPILNVLKNKYEIYLFLSINSDIDQEMIDILKPAKYEFKRFFYDDEWIENRLKNNCSFLGPYNQLSCFYNDKNNFKLIEEYEKENNINFDVISKFRSDMMFRDINQIKFEKDNENDCILHNVELESTIRWHGISSPLLSDAFCFGNKKSMKIYCNTYNWIKEKDIELNGKYNRTFEPYLNENIFGCLFNDPISCRPIYFTFEEYEEKMNHNINNIKYKRYYWPYTLLKNRSVENYKNQPLGEHKIKDRIFFWDPSKDSLILKY